jgi:hypothetical protein
MSSKALAPQLPCPQLHAISQDALDPAPGRLRPVAEHERAFGASFGYNSTHSERKFFTA